MNKSLNILDEQLRDAIVSAVKKQEDYYSNPPYGDSYYSTLDELFRSRIGDSNELSSTRVLYELYERFKGTKFTVMSYNEVFLTSECKNNFYCAHFPTKSCWSIIEPIAIKLVDEGILKSLFIWEHRYYFSSEKFIRDNKDMLLKAHIEAWDDLDDRINYLKSCRDNMVGGELQYLDKL